MLDRRRRTAVLSGVVLALSATMMTQAPAAAAASDFCPPAYICMYRNANWSVMIDSWNGNVTSAAQPFADNSVSSWQNHRDHNWCAWDSKPGRQPDAKLWTMVFTGSNPYVGAAANDKADYATRC
jgi:hypothetical protein